MAGTLIGEIVGRSGGISADSADRTRKFRVQSDNKADYESTILSTIGLPQYNNLHPDDPTLRVRKLVAEQRTDIWEIWIVTVTYEEPETDDPENNEFDNPLERLPDISIDTQSILIAARGEVNSSGTITKAINNTANEPFDPHPEEEVEILAINITRWAIANFSMLTYYKYQNAVNESTWTFGDLSVPEGDAKIRLRIGKREFWRHPVTGVSYSYRQYDFEVLVSPIGWDIELLDWGSAYLDGGVLKKFVNYPADGDGNEFGKLDGAGGKLADGAAPVFLTFKNKKRVDFGALNLPTGP